MNKLFLGVLIGALSLIIYNNIRSYYIKDDKNIMADDVFNSYLIIKNQQKQNLIDQYPAMMNAFILF